MIPKDGKRNGNSESKSFGDEEYLNKLQDEVRYLHFSLK